MHEGHSGISAALGRRTFLVASAVGLAGLGPAVAAPPSRPKAKAAILIWLSGGASHIDTWDMKPDAPAEFRGEFRPIATSAPGIHVCEHLPMLAQQAHHLAVVRSVGDFGRGTGDHHAGYYYNLTGHAPDPSFRALLNERKPLATDWPFLGSVVAASRPLHPDLPQLISLPQKPGFPRYTRPGQFSARLGIEHDPVYVLGNLDRPREFAVPALTLEGGMSADRLRSRRALLEAVDEGLRRFDRGRPEADYRRQQERAFALLGSSRSKAAFDVSREPAGVIARYGETVNGLSLLLARRLVEAGVPFVTVFWMDDPKLDKLCKSGGGWDTHGNNFGCLRDHLLPEFDRGFSALLDDLHRRQMLDETVVAVTSEMGRHPRIGDIRSGGVGGAGRDHWTSCMSVLLAGGGIRGGQVYGASDKIAGHPADHPVGPEDIAQTIYRSLGIDKLSIADREGRPFELLSEGAPIAALFG